MSTISAILDVDVDGTLHLPIPAELRGGKIKVEATLESVEPEKDRAGTEKPNTEWRLPEPRDLGWKNLSEAELKEEAQMSSAEYDLMGSGEE